MISAPDYLAAPGLVNDIEKSTQNYANKVQFYSRKLICFCKD